MLVVHHLMCSLSSYHIDVNAWSRFSALVYAIYKGLLGSVRRCQTKRGGYRPPIAKGFCVVRELNERHFV